MQVGGEDVALDQGSLPEQQRQGEKEPSRRQGGENQPLSSSTVSGRA
jgi:hypothetical protein